MNPKTNNCVMREKNFSKAKLFQHLYQYFFHWKLTCCSLIPRSWTVFCRAFSTASQDSTKDWFSRFKAEISVRSLSTYKNKQTQKLVQQLNYIFFGIFLCKMSINIPFIVCWRAGANPSYCRANTRYTLDN